MNLKVLSLCFLFLSYTCLTAQTIDRTDRADRKVKIELQTGIEITGIVRRGRWIERHQRGAYQTLKSYREPGAGVRLWFVKDAPGYVFIPYVEIKRIQKIEIVSFQLKKQEIEAKAEQLRVGTKRSDPTKIRTNDRPDLGKKTDPAKKTDPVEKTDSAKKTDPVKKTEEPKKEIEIPVLTEQQAYLLQEFPTGGEWTDERYESIQQQMKRGQTKFVRRVINGQVVLQKGPPFGGASQKERLFVGNFSEWKEAIKVQQKIDDFKKQQEKEKQKLLEPPKKEKKPEVEEKTEEPIRRPPIQIAQETPEEVVQKSLKVIRQQYSNTGNRDVLVVKAIEALGEQGEAAAEAVPTLRYLTKDPSEKIRIAAIQSLGKIRKPEDFVVRILGDVISLGDEEMRKEAVISLGKFSNAEAVHKDLQSALLDIKPAVRYQAALSIGSVKDKASLGELRYRLVNDANASVKIAVASGLISLKSESDYSVCMQRSLEGLLNSDEEIRTLALQNITAIYKYSDSSLVKSYMNKVSDPEIKRSLDILVSGLQQTTPKKEEKTKTEPREKAAPGEYLEGDEY